MIPIVDLHGLPYQIGFDHGNQCRAQVLASMEYYRLAYMDKKISWDTAKRLAKTYESDIQKYDPDILDEIRGIADGAGVEYEDILTLNCRSEMTRMDVSQKIAELSDGCTAFAVMPSVTHDRKTYHAQTWDFATMQREALVIFRIHQTEPKQSILMITEAGLVGGKGMNSAGVSLTLNALRTSGDPSGVPLHVVMRGMLNASSITEAYRASVSSRCAAAACVMIASENCALAIELVPGDVDVFYPVDGYVVHANHILSNRFTGIVDYGKVQSSSSYLRYGRCSALLHKQNGITLEDVKAILADHIGHPNSICMHEDPWGLRHQQYSTNYGVVFDCTDRVVHLCPGNPCMGEYLVLPMDFVE